MNTHTPGTPGAGPTDASTNSTPNPPTNAAANSNEEAGRRSVSPSRRGALVIGAAAILLLVTLVVVAITNPDSGGAHTHDDAPAAGGDAPVIGHIHGIAAAPRGQEPGGRVLIGAHYGLFAVEVTGDDAGTVTRVGDSAADFMALTAAATDDQPGRLLASGHPEVTDTSQPVNLGLMESLDGGKSWESLSLEGAADFHALEHTPQRTWGIDSVTGGLLSSVDERSWQTVHGEALLDLAVDPADPDRVLATTGAGQLLGIAYPHDESLTEVEVDGAPRLGFIDWPATDLLVGIDADGTVWRSANGGTGASEDWVELGAVPGDPTALSVIGDSWFVATSNGLFRGPTGAGSGDGAGEDPEQVLAYTH
ncbi:beta propeller repeat protein [Nocardioides pyridinolyticus]